MGGFNSPVDGVAQTQPDKVTFFIRIVFVFIPEFFFIMGVMCKILFPIRTRQMNEEISKGIVAHADGKSYVDPVTGQEVELLKLSKEEEEEVWIYENFNQSDLEALLSDGPGRIEA